AWAVSFSSILLLIKPKYPARMIRRQTAAMIPNCAPFDISLNPAIRTVPSYDFCAGGGAVVLLTSHVIMKLKAAMFSAAGFSSWIDSVRSEEHTSELQS